MLSHFLMHNNLHPLHKLKQLCSNNLRPPGCRTHFGSMTLLFSPAFLLFCRAASPNGPLWFILEEISHWISVGDRFAPPQEERGLNPTTFSPGGVPVEVLGRRIEIFHQGRTSAFLTKIMEDFGKEKPSWALLGPREWQVHRRIILLWL